MFFSNYSNHLYLHDFFEVFILILTLISPLVQNCIFLQPAPGSLSSMPHPLPHPLATPCYSLALPGYSFWACLFILIFFIFNKLGYQ